MVNTMRRHMMKKHGMSREEVSRITNRRRFAMERLAQPTEQPTEQATEQPASEVGGEEIASVAAAAAGPTYSDAS